jgi:hypothetical protein
MCGSAEWIAVSFIVKIQRKPGKFPLYPFLPPVQQVQNFCTLRLLTASILLFIAEIAFGIPTSGASSRLNSYAGNAPFNRLKGIAGTPLAI